MELAAGRKIILRSYHQSEKECFLIATKAPNLRYDRWEIRQADIKKTKVG